jgi:hypothetical protein
MITIRNIGRAVSALVLTLLLGACASDPNRVPTGNFAKATAKSETIKCPSGYVLTCEAKRTGRIRFGKMGGENLESCSCEVESGVPINSPLPGIY